MHAVVMAGQNDESDDESDDSTEPLGAPEVQDEEEGMVVDGEEPVEGEHPGDANVQVLLNSMDFN